MLADRPDVVHILTPPVTHARIAADCLRAGAHVVIEKPVAPTHPEFRELWALARETKQILIEDQNYRFNEPVVALQRVVAEGQIGELREVEVCFVTDFRDPAHRYMDGNLLHSSHRMPAGIIHEFITHLAYLTQMFLPEFDELDCVAAAWSKHDPTCLMKYDDLDALVVVGKVHARIRLSSHTSPGRVTVKVVGTRGWAETEIYNPYLRIVRPRPGGPLTPLINQWINGASGVRAGFKSFKDKMLGQNTYTGIQVFLDRTYAALRDEGEFPVTYTQMDSTSRLIDALLSEENRV
jgi:predicted dehydrogenase